MRTETFETPGPLTLRLRVSSSEVEIETWQHPSTRIEIEGGRGGDKTRELVEAFTVALHERPNGQEVVIEDPKSRVRGFSFREAHASVRVWCPEGTALTAATGSADVSVTGALGQVEIKTGSGDVGSADIAARAGDPQRCGSPARAAMSALPTSPAPRPSPPPRGTSSSASSTAPSRPMRSRATSPFATRDRVRPWRASPET